MKTHISRAIPCAAVVLLVAPVLGVMTASLIGGASQLLHPSTGRSSALLITGCLVAASLGAVTLMAFVVGMRAILGKASVPPSEEPA